jgi:RND family efflux transporter MFP subunit
MPPRPVHVAPVLSETLEAFRPFTGSLRAVSRAGIAALEEGQVMEVTVQEGDRIEKGHVLARLDDRRLRAQLGEKEASLEVSKATLAQRNAELDRAKQDYSRSENLLQNAVVTEKEFDHAIADVAVAEAQVNAAEKLVHQIESEIELLKVRLEDLTVEAPFTGKVIERHVEPGVWIHQGDQVATLVSSGTIEAWIEVPERYAKPVSSIDHPIDIEIHATGNRVTAHRAEAIPDVHSRTRNFWLVARIPNENDRLAPGMSIQGWLPTSEKSHQLTVFKDAVIRDSISAFVYKAVQGEDGGQQAVRVPVRVIFEAGDRVAVTSSNLAEGDLVVIEGNERLLPGTKVSLVEKDAPSLARAEESASEPDRAN